MRSAIHTAVKGRTRYKGSGLHRSEALKTYLEFRLSKEEIITQVSANHLTGNILVIFHPNFSSDAIALLIQGIVLDYRKLHQQNTHDWEQKTPSWLVRSADAAITEFNTSAASGLS